MGQRIENKPLGIAQKPVSKEGARETSLPGFGVTPKLNIPQDWGIEQLC